MDLILRKGTANLLEGGIKFFINFLFSIFFLFKIILIAIKVEGN